jgi:hypothetical protein
MVTKIRPRKERRKAIPPTYKFVRLTLIKTEIMNEKDVNLIALGKYKYTFLSHRYF